MKYGDVMKEILKLTFIASIMGILYLIIELLYKGYTYWQMAIIGGIAGMLTGYTNSILKWKLPLWLQGALGMVIATVCEFTGGYYFNLCKHYSIWDYSNLPFNFHGQICLYYSIAWFFLSMLGIFLYNNIRIIVFGESKQDK